MLLRQRLRLVGDVARGLVLGVDTVVGLGRQRAVARRRLVAVLVLAEFPVTLLPLALCEREQHRANEMCHGREAAYANRRAEASPPGVSASSSSSAAAPGERTAAEVERC